MKRRMAALAVISVVAVVAVFVSAPVAYSQTIVCSTHSLVYTCDRISAYPNWESLSCRAFGLGMYYGRTVENTFVFQPNDSYQLGCPSPTAYFFSW
jgi:hypothetical protein